MIRIYQKNWTQHLEFHVELDPWNPSEEIAVVAHFEGCHTVEDNHDLLIKLKERFDVICIPSHGASLKMNRIDLDYAGFEINGNCEGWFWYKDNRGHASNETIDRLIVEHYVKHGQLNPEDVEGTSTDIMDWRGLPDGR